MGRYITFYVTFFSDASRWGISKDHTEQFSVLTELIFQSINGTESVTLTYVRNDKDVINRYKQTFVMRRAIWYHLHNFKNVKNTHGGVLFKLYKWYQIAQSITYDDFTWFYLG